MNLAEKTLESTLIYAGKFIRLKRDRAQLPDGKEGLREVVEHPGAVAIVPLDQEGNVVMVRQYRYPMGKVLLEVPAGKMEPGEDIRICALRELEEETGLVPGELTCLGSLYPSPGFCDEIIHLYLARDLTQGQARPDEDEFLQTSRVPLSRLVEAVMNNEIQDGKTVAALLKTKLLLGL